MEKIGAQPNSSNAEFLWKQYALHVDLYKFYLDMSMKGNAFYYAITGSILTYYFQNASNGAIRYALLLPIAFSFALGSVFFYGASRLGVVRDEVFKIRDKLGLEAAPEMMVLIIFLRLFGTILICTGLALAWFVWIHPV
jgi:hypothetical protein